MESEREMAEHQTDLRPPRGWQVTETLLGHGPSVSPIVDIDPLFLGVQRLERYADRRACGLRLMLEQQDLRPGLSYPEIGGWHDRISVLARVTIGDEPSGIVRSLTPTDLLSRRRDVTRRYAPLERASSVV